MDQVFQEEQAKLAEIEGKITASAEAEHARAIELDKEIRDFYAIDYEDIGRKKLLIDERAACNQARERILEYSASPYFARLDLDRETRDGYEVNSHYIGKKGLTLGSEVVVVDWRAPLGEIYYAQNQTSFKIRGDEYSLALRRRLDIQDAALLSYYTEYDGNTVSLEGDVIDPFLLTVLKDKRRQNRLTDIIRSIQANQNQIIRRPKDESFIVQGCAGSGKTMILLHRLSYLKFNDRQMSLSGVKIITPNHDFNAHINALSGELDIDTIERFTVEEYYVRLIGQYSHASNVSADVGSESELKPTLLGELYSTAFADQLREQYHLYWDDILQGMDEPRLRLSFQRHAVPFPDLAAHNAATATNLEMGVHRVLSEARERAEKNAELTRRRDALEGEYQDTDALCERISVAISENRERLIEMLRAEHALVSDDLARRADALNPIRERLQTLKAQDDGTAKAARQAESALNSIRQHYQAYVEYSGFLPINDEISADIAATCKDVLERIHSLEDQIQRTPGYNFLKRNNLRRQLQGATRRYSEEARARLDALTAEKEAEMAQASKVARAQQAEAEALSRTIEAAEREIAELQSRQGTLHNGMTALLNSKPSDAELPLNYNALVSMDIPEALVDGLTDHERLMANRANQEKRLTDLRRQIGIIEGQMLPPYGDDIAHLEQCEAEIARLKPNELYRQVFRRALTGAYRRHGVTYTRTNYRHKLYLTLRFCTLYYSRPRGVVDSYLNIDEAQDISMVEYRLLREILGNKCVFNLYGDINQALFPEKCVMDWEELREIVGAPVYVLNEDYRNTLQITEYCNRAFSAEIYPIGIKGAPVAELDWPKGVAWLAKLKKANPNGRAAVIVHREMEALRGQLIRSISEEGLSWHSVDDAKVSVLTVEQAKGLEFEAVLVLSDGMEINEQYIAFTRALEYLCVVK